VSKEADIEIKEQNSQIPSETSNDVNMTPKTNTQNEAENKLEQPTETNTKMEKESQTQPNEENKNQNQSEPEELQIKKAAAQELTRQIFEIMDVEHSGDLTWRELEKGLTAIDLDWAQIFKRYCCEKTNFRTKITTFTTYSTKQTSIK